MEITTIAWIGAGVIGAGAIYLLGKGWITIYNKFVYWRTRAERAFADLDIIMQRRIDMLPALAQVAKKYSIHEYKTIKETIEARSGWSKDAPLSKKVEMENNFMKLQAVFEKYPEVKADKLYQQIMGGGSITRIERKLEEYRRHYNKIAQDYNERVQIFPRNIIAKFHGFKIMAYLTLGNQINKETSEDYKAKELFDD